ncbi:MAG: hypothetical protein ACI837_002358 [Crocinitomicaceae bacterium]|jgi:hypothetical protein
MKNLLVIIFILSSVNAMSQYCRAIHSIENSGTLNHRGTGITELNNQTYFVTLATSMEDTLQFTVSSVDSRGETSNYTHSEVLGITGLRYAISGIAANGDDLIVVVIAESLGSASLTYIRYNAFSGSIIETNTLPTAYNKGYVRSRQKGDSVITYMAHPSGTSRIATNLSGAFVPTNVDYTSTMMYNGGGMSTGQRKSELIISDSGIEYVAINYTIVKRSTTGIYQEMALPGFLSNNGFTMNLNNLDELLVISGQNFYLFNTSFAIINQGVLSFSTGSPTRFAELYFRSGNWCLFYRASAPNTSTKAVLNNNIDSVSEFPLSGGRVSPYDQFETTNGRYIVGYQEHSVPRESGVIIKDVDLQSPGVFYESTQQINHNKLQFYTGHLNLLFNMEGDIHAGFYMEHEGVNKPVFYSSYTSILGETSMGDTAGFLPQYYPSMLTYPGPYTPTGSKSYDTMDKYNRGLYVDKAMIDNHIAQISTSNPSYEIPIGILNWPAHGDVSLGQAQDIAAFFDQNGNQIYEPELGDYPSIYGNRCILKTYHQADGAELAGLADLNLECLEYIYVYNCDSNEALMNTVFVNQQYPIYNSTLDTAYIGARVDFEVGNYLDDFVGTFVDLGMTYAYNADLYDEDLSGIYGGIGFHEHPPASGVLFLKGAKAELDGVDNLAGIAADQSINGFGFGAGSVDNEYFGLTSSYSTLGTAGMSDEQFYNWLQGKEAAGNYPQVNSVDVRHAYFGNSAPLFYAAWGQDHGNNHSEITAGNSPGDQKLIGSTGTINLDSSNPSANSTELLTAYIVAIDSILLPTDPGGDPVKKLYQLGQTIKNIHLGDSLACGTFFEFYTSPVPLTLDVEELALEIEIYPNPTQKALNVVSSEVINSLVLMDASGRVVYRSYPNSNTVELNVSKFLNGMYFMQISTNHGTISKKIVK